MKSAFITFLIISFVGVAVFGFLSMIFDHTHNGGCIASNRLGAFCPQNSAFAFVVFHISAFKYFSTAVLNAVLSILITVMAFSILPRPLDKDEEDCVFGVQSEKFPILIKNKEIIRWLSLHINSPALAA